MIEQIVKLALMGSAHTLQSLQDERFRGLVCEGEDVVRRVNSGSYATDILPFRLGVAKFALIMNTKGVAAARDAARSAEPCILNADWARERAWFVRFGEFLVDQADALLPDALQKAVGKLLAARPVDGLEQESLQLLLFDTLESLVKESPRLEHPATDSPDVTVLPWRFAGRTFQTHPSCLGLALVVAALLRRCKRESCLVVVPRAAQGAVASHSVLLSEQALSFARRSGIYLSHRRGRFLLDILAEASRPAETHVAMFSKGFDGGWFLSDPYLKQFGFELGREDIHLSRMILAAYPTSGLSRFVRNEMAEEFLSQPQLSSEPYQQAALEAAHFVSVEKDPLRAFKRLGRLGAIRLLMPSGLNYMRSFGAQLGDLQTERFSTAVAFHMLNISGLNGETYHSASPAVRKVFHEVASEAKESARIVIENPRFDHFVTTVCSDVQFLSNLMRRLPGIILCQSLAVLGEDWKARRMTMLHPEMEIMDVASGFGMLVLATVAKNAGLSFEFETLLYRHCTLLDRYLFWAEFAQVSGEVDERACLSQELLRSLPTKHPEALTLGRERNGYVP